MKEETAICQRLTKEGADSVMLEQYRHYQETGNLQGQYRLVCRFRRVKSEELEKERDFDFADYRHCRDSVLAGDKNGSQCGKLEDGLYSAKYQGDYHFSGFLEAGGAS